MRIGSTKVNDDGWQVVTRPYQAINRRSEMEQKIMKGIMRVVVAGSIIAILVNVMMVFG